MRTFAAGCTGAATGSGDRSLGFRLRWRWRGWRRRRRQTAGRGRADGHRGRRRIYARSFGYVARFRLMNSRSKGKRFRRVHCRTRRLRCLGDRFRVDPGSFGGRRLLRRRCRLLRSRFRAVLGIPRGAHRIGRHAYGFSPAPACRAVPDFQAETYVTAQRRVHDAAGAQLRQIQRNVFRLRAVADRKHRALAAFWINAALAVPTHQQLPLDLSAPKLKTTVCGLPLRIGTLVFDFK